jgi:hypothetical protein
MPELTYPAAKKGVNGPGFPPELLEGASKPEPTSWDRLIIRVAKFYLHL